MIEQFDLFEETKPNNSKQTIIHGDCLTVMASMEHDSIDFAITDPPYGLKFMNKAWDHGIPIIKYWKELIRILKPGSMLAAFGGTRTQHRLTCAIEDAGFEIRDCIMWLYGSGFPKSHNHFGLPGFGTQLKPSYEPIIIAMKPLDGTYAQNVERWGLGGINIDASRIESNEKWSQKCHDIRNNGLMKKKGRLDRISQSNDKGRWPSNIILSPESAELLDQQSGILKSGLISKHHNINQNRSTIYQDGLKSTNGLESYGDSGGASRFFYVTKASSRERNKGLEGLWFDKLELVLHNGTSFDLEELWVIEGQNQKMNLDSEVSQKKDMLEDLIKNLDDKECYIISCGNNISELFPKTIKFTTLMGSKQTIELKTLDFYLPLNINDCIQDVIKTNKENGINLVENVGLCNLLKRIFTKEKIASLLGVKNAVRKMQCLISVKEELKQSNIHSTVKPIALMKYIIKLLAPPNNPTLIDPFLGSGTTLLACKEMSINAIGIEKEEEYVNIAKQRLESW